MLKRQYVYYAAIAVIGITLLFYFVNQERNKVPYALGVDAIKDTTDIAGTYYRIRVTNTGTNMATNISVYLGQNDIQHLKESITRSILVLLSTPGHGYIENQCYG